VRVTLTLAFASLLAAGSAAQPYPGDYFVGARFCTPHKDCNGQFIRVTPQGQIVRFLASTNSGMVGSSATDATNRQVAFFYSDTSGSFVRVHDATSDALVLTSRLPAYWSYAGLHSSHTGELVTVGDSPGVGPCLMVLSADYRRWTTLTRLPGSWSLPGSHIAQTQDLISGDYLVTHGSLNPPYRFQIDAISPDGRRSSTVTTLAVSGTNTGAAIVQSHRNGALIAVGGPGIFSYDRRIGWTTLSTVGRQSAVALDRSPGSGMLTAFQGATLQRIDLTGRVLSSAQTQIGIPVVGICHARGRNLASARRGSPNDWDLHLSFPGEGGRNYVLGLSVTGFTPGISIGGRQIALRPDPVLAMSVSGRLAPYLTNNLGALSPQGEAVARLDLRPFGSALSGTLVWAAAITLDPQAPSGIATISKPIVIVLD